MTTTSQTATPANLSAGRPRVGSWTVTPSKTLLRSTVDRLLRPHFDQLTDGLTAEVRSLQAKIDATSVEIRSEVNETTTRELADRLATMSVEIRSEVNGTVIREISALTAELSAKFSAEMDALRADYVELTRMFRMQGDAADQVAEALGRTLTRLTAELESFGGGLEELEEHLETDHADHGRSEGATSHS